MLYVPCKRLLSYHLINCLMLLILLSTHLHTRKPLCNIHQSVTPSLHRNAYHGFQRKVYFMDQCNSSYILVSSVPPRANSQCPQLFYLSSSSPAPLYYIWLENFTYNICINCRHEDEFKALLCHVLHWHSVLNFPMDESWGEVWKLRFIALGWTRMWLISWVIHK